MSRRKDVNDKAGKNAGIARALEELIEKNRTQAVELEMLAQVVEAEIAAAQEREAAQAVRLSKALSELAEAVATVELEKSRRIEAEEFVVELSAAVDGLKAVLTRFPSADSVPLRGMIRGDEVADPLADVQNVTNESARSSADATTGNYSSDLIVLVNDQCRTKPADMSDERTVRIVINLSPTEALALETFAARTGKYDTVAFATSLICDGLRRLGPGSVPDENGPPRE